MNLFWKIYNAKHIPGKTFAIWGEQVKRSWGPCIMSYPWIDSIVVVVVTLWAWTPRGFPLWSFLTWKLKIPSEEVSWVSSQCRFFLSFNFASNFAFSNIFLLIQILLKIEISFVKITPRWATYQTVVSKDYEKL